MATSRRLLRFSGAIRGTRDKPGCAAAPRRPRPRAARSTPRPTGHRNWDATKRPCCPPVSFRWIPETRVGPERSNVLSSVTVLSSVFSSNVFPPTKSRANGHIAQDSTGRRTRQSSPVEQTPRRVTRQSTPLAAQPSRHSHTTLRAHPYSNCAAARTEGGPPEARVRSDDGSECVVQSEFSGCQPCQRPGFPRLAKHGHPHIQTRRRTRSPSENWDRPTTHWGGVIGSNTTC